MIAAIYARRSTEDERSAEDGRSIDRQVELARAFAESKGWAVAESYTDDGISGADFTRPGLVKLLDDVRAKKFQVVVVMSLDRIGRDQVRTSVVIQQLHDAGVEVWTYQDGQRVKFHKAVDKFMVGVHGFGAEQYREAVRDKVREALRTKAAKGHQTSGRTYGYDRIRVGDHTEKRVNEEQAAVVKRVFTMAAEGAGDDRIAAALAKDRIPYPGARWTKRPVAKILGNEIYTGKVIYGKTTNVDDGGAGKRIRVPESEWITTEHPDLRLVDDKLWEAVQKRKAATRAHYVRGEKGRLMSKPEAGITSKYMLSGIARCSVCGSTMTFVGDRKTKRYYCLGRMHKGAEFCSNVGGVPMDLLDKAVIGVLLDEVMSDRERLWRLISEADDARERKASRVPDRSREIAKVQGEINRLVESLASGKGGTSITAAIDQREGRLALLKGETAAVVPPVSRQDFLTAWERFRVTLNQRHPAQVRQLLRKLGCTRIVVTRTGEKTWDFAGEFDAGRVIKNGPSDSSGGVIRLM